MAVYAAQVDALDQGVGQIMAALIKAGRDENTLVLFLSDNGASAEGGRRGFTKGKQGAETGTPDSYDSYGLSWANASNTPFRWFKSRVHEGGISTPLIARWPRGIQRRGQLEAQVGHVIDLLPTCLDVAGMAYPERFQERDRLPPEGISLRNVFTGKPKQERTLFWEHEGNRAVRVGDWKLVAIRGKPWELYNLAADRTERNDLSTKDPARVERLAGLWQAWADRCGVMVKEARSQASQPTAKTPAVPAAAEK